MQPQHTQEIPDTNRPKDGSAQRLAIHMAQVVKSYGKRQVLNELCLDVSQGSCVALLGPNGAGKTTTMKILTGQVPAQRGTVEVFGETLTQAKVALRARIGLVPQNDNLEAELTVRDNLDIYARLFGIRRRQRAVNVERSLRATNLQSHADRRVQTLSGGYRRRALIARALVSQPELLILDEPTVGLDPEVRLAILSTLQQLKDDGLSILIASHYIDELSDVTDAVTIIREGAVLRSCSLDELSRFFADYRTVVPQGALAAELALLSTEPATNVYALGSEGDNRLFVVHVDRLAGSTALDAISRNLSFGDMYLATLKAA